MELAELMEVLGNKYNARILQATDEPKSAQELSDALQIPIATSYRRIEELTDAKLLELVGKEFSNEGRRTKKYRRCISAIEFDFTAEAVELTLREREEMNDPLVNVWSQLRSE